MLGSKMFLSDQETAVDLLYSEAIARTVVKLVSATPETPVTVGVHGDWGAGKSSVLKMTSDAFKSNDRALCIWFNGWTFEGFEDAKTVVIETIVEELRRARPNSTKVADAAKKVFKRIDWLKVAKKTGGFAFTAMTGIPTLDQLQGLYDLASSVIAKPQDHISLDDLKSVAAQVGECLKDADGEADNVSKQIHEFRKEFAELIDAADIDQLVVIVDDLDRCLPSTAISTLEAIRLFLFVPKTAFVIGADELMIEYAVREHFPDLPPSSGSVPYARNYLEKLIQVPFRIPALGLAETQIYVTLLLAESHLGSSSPEFKTLLAAGRELLKKPWNSRGIDHAACEKALSSKTVPNELLQALKLAQAISPILTDGTRGNPRQIKRFLNSMMLRVSIAEARGFRDELDPTILAKIMLAERFSPELYEHLARLAALDQNGMPKAVADLEDFMKSAAPQNGAGKKPDAKAAKASASTMPPKLATELDTEWAKGWATIDPPLRGVDLRPYVFVTRDKRGYLGGFAAPTHLQSLAESLLGPPLAVRSKKPEVGQLSASDAEQLFDALRSQVLQTDDWKVLPSGVHGLVLVSEEHPNLQRKLLTFIQELSISSVGPWAATSWGACFKSEPLQSEWHDQLTDWSGQSENAALKNAAKSALQMQKKA